jgi:hypothetical protein
MKRRYLLMAAILICLAGVYGFTRLVASPSHGQPVKNGTPSRKHVEAADQLPSTTIKTEYFELALPAGYRPQEAQPVLGLLYAQTLTKPSSSGSLIINISIKTMPEGGLAGDSSYKLRQQKVERYRLTTQSISGEAIQIANDAESAAVVAFWPHAGYLATISISSGVSNPSSNDNAAELSALQPLLKAWRWQ